MYRLYIDMKIEMLSDNWYLLLRMSSNESVHVKRI